MPLSEDQFSHRLHGFLPWGRLLSFVFKVIVAALALHSPFAVSGDAVGAPSEFSHEELLQTFESELRDGYHNEFSARESSAYQRLLGESVTLLPSLAEKLASLDDSSSLHQYMLQYLFSTELSGLSAYLYSDTPYMLHGMQLLEEDKSTLPFLHVKIGENYSSGEQRRRMLIWWGRIQAIPDFDRRLAGMHDLTGGVRPDASNLTPEVYRAYTRMMSHYGIYNLPILARLIIEDDNPVAFTGFLVTTRSPHYVGGDWPLPVVERVQAVAARFPKHGERIAIVRQWWEEHRESYQTVPPLAAALEAAINQ